MAGESTLAANPDLHSISIHPTYLAFERTALHPAGGPPSPTDLRRSYRLQIDRVGSRGTDNLVQGVERQIDVLTEQNQR